MAMSPDSNDHRSSIFTLGGMLLVIFTFLLASSPARNSDVWRHLATGRALLDGSYALGSDPFAHTTAGVYWVNHSWLYDTATFLVFQHIGPETLLIVMALLVAGLCALLLLAAGQGGWIGFLSIGLAMLAMGPYLSLRPSTISYVLLGATFVWSERASRSTATIWPPLILVALWANLDEWFFLGSLVIGLYALGLLLQRRSTAPGEKPALRDLSLVFAGSLAVCVLNPHHVRVFSLPPLLDPFLSVEWQQLLGRELFVSPFHADYLKTPLGMSPAGWAYYLLLLLGLASLVARGIGRNWSRDLVLLTFGVLSGWRAGLIPFFAVVAGPAIALNFGEVLARRRPAVDFSAPATWRLRLAWASLLLLLLLAVAGAWTGWLVGGPFEPRRWSIEADPSLVKAADAFARWHEAGRIDPKARGFNLSPDVAHYLAWFCPREKSFADTRAHLFPANVVADFLALRRQLAGSAAPSADDPSEREDWPTALHRLNITHLIIHDASERRLTAALDKVLAAPAEWPLIHLEGRTVVFASGNADKSGKSACDCPAVDLSRRAYEVSEPDKAPPSAGQERPEPRRWWHALYRPLPAANIDRDEAIVYLAHFEAQRSAYRRRHFAHWQSTLAAGTCLATPSGGWHANTVAQQLPFALLAASLKPSRPDAKSPPDPREQMALSWFFRYLVRQDDGPPESLHLAIRSARRAIHTNPNDPVPYLLLAGAYQRLLEKTAERSAAPASLLYQLRQIQIIVACKQALLLKDQSPRFPEQRPHEYRAHEHLAHKQLAELYQKMGLMDLALSHWLERVRLLRAVGPMPQEDADAFAERLEQMQDMVDALQKQVRDAIHLHETHTFKLDVFGKALKAHEMGLPGHALDLLLRSQYEVFGTEGARLELQLLLTAGRVKELLDWTEWFDPQQEAKLGRFPFRWLQTQLAAALGNYAQADEQLQQLSFDRIDVPGLGMRNVPVTTAAAAVVAKYVLDSAQLCLKDDVRTFLGRVEDLALHIPRHAEVLLMRGMLAMEWGETAYAARLFRQALEMSRAQSDGAAAPARRYLQQFSRK